MSLLLPVTTIVLVILGAFCLFIAIENDSYRVRSAQKRTSASTCNVDMEVQANYRV